MFICREPVLFVTSLHITSNVLAKFIACWLDVKISINTNLIMWQFHAGISLQKAFAKFCFNSDERRPIAFVPFNMTLIYFIYIYMYLYMFLSICQISDASLFSDRPGRKGPLLTWAQRLKIAVDVARGLNYLHFDRAVPHGNLKATNILLDGPDLNARVADYCLHRLMTQAGTMEQILDAGILGYRAPELAASKKPLPSFKSDVYAFGVILLELLTGRCAGDVISGLEGGVDLTDWVRLRAAEGRGSECFDPAVMLEMGNPAIEKGMKEVLGIALRCIRSVSERPGIKTIYEDLSSI